MDEKKVDPLKMEICYSNPWQADDPSVFLKYCCPECDYINPELLNFTNHALENHVEAGVMFAPDEIENNKSEHSYSKLESSLEFPLHLEKTNEQNGFDSLLIKVENEVQEENVSCFQLPEGFSHLEMKQNEVTFSNEVEDIEVSKSDTVGHFENKYTKRINGKHCCPCCEYKTSNKSHLKMHIDRKHAENAEKNNICEKCNTSFMFQSSLKKHICKSDTVVQLETKISKQHSCPCCEYKCPQEYLIKKHIDREHPEYRKELTHKWTKRINGQHCCPCCEYKVSNKAHLKVHIDRKHPEYDEKKVICDKCSMSFIFQASLKVHDCKYSTKTKKDKKLNFCPC